MSVVATCPVNPRGPGEILLLFHPEHVPKIIDEEKTETRRMWAPRKARPKIGSIHLAYTRPPFARPPGKPFARLKILDVYKEVLGLISPASVMNEGYMYYMDFVQVWIKINGCWSPGEIIDVVKFKLVEVLPMVDEDDTCRHGIRKIICEICNQDLWTARCSACGGVMQYRKASMTYVCECGHRLEV